MISESQIVQEETRFPEGSRVVPINPAAKYILVVPLDALPKDEGEASERLKELADILDMWWNDGGPFFVMTNEITLVKIGEVDLLLEENNDEEKT